MVTLHELNLETLLPNTKQWRHIYNQVANPVVYAPSTNVVGITVSLGFFSISLWHIDLQRTVELDNHFPFVHPLLIILGATWTECVYYVLQPEGLKRSTTLGTAAGGLHWTSLGH